MKIQDLLLKQVQANAAIVDAKYKEYKAALSNEKELQDCISFNKYKHNTINTISDINNNITNLNTVDTETDARLDALEEHDTTNCVTAEDVGEVQEPHS